MASYNPAQILLLFGVIPISGFADGSMIEVVPVGPGTKVVQGTQGETTFIKTSNRQVEVNFRLFESAFSNVALSAYYNTLDVPVPVILVSLSTGAVAAAGAGSLERIPGTTYDGNVPVRDWKIICPVFDQQLLPVALGF